MARIRGHRPTHESLHRQLVHSAIVGLAGLSGLVACFDATVGDAVVACGGNADCIGGVCFLGQCRSDDFPCLQMDRDVAMPVDDGKACGDASICVAGTCVASRCGDGFISAGEGCDDPNDNPADGCNRCQSVAWQSEVLVRGAVDGFVATDVPLSAPDHVAVDPLGRIYVTERQRHRVWRRDLDGTMVVVAGNGAPGFGGDGGAATEAFLHAPGGLFADTRGRLFIADTRNGRVRVVDSDGTITTVAGSGVPPPADNADIVDGALIGDNAAAVGALLRDPSDVVVDVHGRVWIADTGGRRVRRVEIDGTIVTVAGTGARGIDGDGGPATAARLDTPVGLALDADGDVYVVDSVGSVVRRIKADGRIESVAGRGTYSARPPTDGELALEAELALPTGVAFDREGRMLVAESLGSQVRRVDLDGRLRVVLGGDDFGFADGIDPAVIRVAGVTDIDVDADGGIVMADPENRRIRSYDEQLTTMSTVAGSGRTNAPVIAQPATSTPFDFVSALALDGAGRILVADVNAGWIARIEPDGTIRHVAGSGAGGTAEDGDLAADAPLTPRALAVDPLDRIVVADGGGYVWRIDHDGRLIRLAGRGRESPLDPEDGITVARDAQAAPFGVVVDAQGRVFFSEPETHRVRRIDPDGTIHTVAGTGVAGFAGDGGPAATALLESPTDVDLDADGQLYIADIGTQRLRVVGLDGNIRTLAGTGVAASGPDGVRADECALSFGFSSVAIAADGTVRLADAAGPTVRAIDADGTVRTVAGGGGSGFVEDGGPATASSFRSIDGVVALPNGGFVAVVGAVRIIRVAVDGTLESIAGPIHPRGPGLFARARLYAPQAIAMLDDQRLVSVGGAGRVLLVDLTRGLVSVAVGFEHAWQGVAQNARFAPLLQEPRGIAVHPATRTLVVSNRDSSRLCLVDADVDDDGAIDGADSWRAVDQEAGLVAPAGITSDPVTGGFLVADAGAHCVVAVDADYRVVETIAGVCGRAGSFAGFLQAPTNALRAPSGAVYVADTGNHRVLRVAGGSVAVVVGDGSPSSAGEGAPARLFPVRSPRQMAIDQEGNLYVASTTTVRLVVNVDDDEEADGDDRVATIFGGGERIRFPESDALCVGALALDERGSVYVADACQGFLVRLALAPVPRP
jgi:cysteine-rich repeat protein